MRLSSLFNPIRSRVRIMQLTRLMHHSERPSILKRPHSSATVTSIGAPRPLAQNSTVEDVTCVARATFGEVQTSVKTARKILTHVTKMAAGLAVAKSLTSSPGKVL